MKRDYAKVAEDTTWEGAYQVGVTLDVALSTTKNEFAECARLAGAKSYDLRVYGALPMTIVTDSR